MRPFTGRLLFCLTLLLLLAAPVAAQETVALEEAIARALQQSARIVELEARQAGAAATEDARAAARLPIVAAQGSYVRTSHVEEYSFALPGQPLRVLYPDVPDNYRARLDLQWPIYSGGRTEALERAARAEKDALDGDLDAVRADLRLDVTRAFWALVTARETEQVVARSVERMDAHLRDLRTRLQQGLISPSDVTSAEAQRSRQQLLAIEARNMRQISEADLRRLIGGTGPIAPAVSGAFPQVVEPEKVAVPVRPERRALEQRLEASAARQDAARAGAKPQIAAVGGFDYARPNPRIFPRAARWEDFWELGVNVSWTLWDGGRRKAEQAEAAAATRAVQARITDFDRQVAFEQQQRAFELDSARASIDAATDGIRSAEESLRVIQERYRVGVVTSTEVLDAEIALLQAELDRTRALAASRLAAARLERALGR